MVCFYLKPIFVIRQICLVVLFISVITTSQAQQTAPAGKNPAKLEAGDPLYKIGSELATLYAGKSAARTNRQAQQPALPLRKPSLLQIQGDYVAVEAVTELNQTRQLLADLTALGMKNPAAYGRIISGLIPIDKLDEVAALKNLHFARPTYKPMQRIGQVTSQGDVAMYADSVRKKQGIDGRGSKIGVISDSYNSLGGAEKGILSGDLPGAGNPNGYTTPVQVLQDYPFSIDEGRAMMEIIHDVAPGAQLAFHTAFLGEAGYAQGILALQEAGCNIITDDIAYLSEPMFQDGIIAQAVEEVVQKGVSYFPAAGNYDRQSYETEFKSSGKSIIINGINYGVAHDFGNGDTTQTIHIPRAGSFRASFQWDDPFFSVSGLPGAQTDLDILVFYQGQLLTGSIEKNIGNDPFELISLATDSTFTADIEICIVKYGGPDPTRIKWVNFGYATPLEHVTNSSTIVGHSNAAGAVSTGAVFFQNTPAYGTSPPVRESFSSAGGTPILFDVNGNRQMAEVRQKPDIMAPTRVFTSFFYYPIDGNYYFPGTSAAAPHAAAVAALMQEASGITLSPAAITKTLQQTAVDMDTPGFDFETGYGFVNAFAAVAAVAKNRIRYITLVNAVTGQEIQTIEEGDVINLTRFPYPNVLIRAYTGPAQVGSVVLQLNNNQVIDNQAPYEYPGGENNGIKLSEGDYTLVATPYTEANGQGERGLSLTIHFKAVNEKIIRFELMDVAENKVIKTLKTGDLLYLPDLPNNLNIRAITSPDSVGSVKFNLNGIKTIDNLPPYEVANNAGGGIDFSTGVFILSATTYPEQMARGTAGNTRTIYFAAVNLSEQEVAFAAGTLNKVPGGLSVFPNPVVQTAKIRFSVPESGDARLTIYNLTGRRVALLHDGFAEGGKAYEYTLDGASLPAGWYIAKVVTNKTTFQQKLRLAK